MQTPNSDWPAIAIVQRKTLVMLGPDYMSRAGSVYRDLGTSVKRNKNQLCDYMTTGPARLSGLALHFSSEHNIRRKYQCYSF